MLAGRLRVAFATLAIVAGGHSAHAHGIAGNRFFPGTLAFDDPAVADEAIVPLYLTFKHPAEISDGQVVDNAFNWSLFRLLTPTLGVAVDSGCDRDLTSRAWTSRAKSTGTISMRSWSRLEPPGVSDARALRAQALTRPT
jgi:hypothetical protein